MIKKEFENLDDNVFVDLTEGIRDCLVGLFEINKLGQIRNKKTSKLISVTPKKQGDYPTVYLRKTPTEKYIYRIHILIAKTFLQKANEDEVEVDHIDRDTTNYTLSNLRWVSKSENKKNRVFSKDSYQYFKFWISFEDINYSIPKGRPIFDEELESKKDIEISWKNRTSLDKLFWKPFLTNDKNLFNKFIYPTDWKLIPNSNNSYCSSTGLIMLTGKNTSDIITTGHLINSGYRVVNIKKKLFRVHRLVYSLFGDGGLNDFEIIDHIDTDRSNNNINNLKKVSNQKENLNNPITRVNISKPVIKFDLNGNFIKQYNSCMDAYEDLGVDPKTSSHISDCCKNKMKSYKGFIWKYKQ